MRALQSLRKLEHESGARHEAYIEMLLAFKPEKNKGHIPVCEAVDIANQLIEKSKPEESEYRSAISDFLLYVSMESED